VARAIERAVIDRMGDVQVVVHEVSTRVADRSGLAAAIEPGSRLGQPIRFVLTAAGERVGSAVARIEVVGRAPAARRAFARDEEITAGDVDLATVEIKNVMLRRMPELGDVVGARARRDIVAGELLTSALVSVPPAVRSGDEVRVIVTMGQVEVSGVGRASGSGQVGDMIQVATSSRKVLKARIVGRGAVEIHR
jgi:flagella basal body P-ring formation protein FlgA